MTIEATGGVVHWVEMPGGVRIRAAHWPNGPRGTVLLLNGRGEFIEKYAETIAALQTRGFAVWTLDWRGQGASSRVLPDPIPNHVARFRDHLDDLGWLLDSHIVPTLGGRKLVMLAHSMGGHLGLRTLARRPALFARAILSAPMIDFLKGNRVSWRVSRVAILLACLVPGKATTTGPRGAPLPDFDKPFDGNPLTTCPDRFAADLALLRATPTLAVGGATWGWMRAATTSIMALKRPGFPRRISMPVLIAIAEQERLVNNDAIRRLARRLPHAELLELQGARHELLREQDRHQAKLWAEIDRFLEPIGC
jgi:lysophospholipase